MIHILVLDPGPVPPPDRPQENPFAFMDGHIAADVIQSCWGTRESHPASRFDLPNVKYHFIYDDERVPRSLRKLRARSFLLRQGLRLFREGRRYEVIFVYGVTATAAAGLCLKMLTGGRLIVDVAGDPRTAFLADTPRPGIGDIVKHHAALIWTKFVLQHVDHIKLLFPEQLDVFPNLKGIPRSVFPAFVPVSQIEPSTADDRYILLLGFPWYLKGVDVLIKAFHGIAGEFPDHRLKIVGHCRDRSAFESLRRNHPRIELLAPVAHEDALRLIAGATCLVLPSRTETMGRVLIEAMATGKAVIASRVGGIPHYVSHGQTGLLFESENVEQLAGCLRQVIGDDQLRLCLGQRGLERVRRAHSERTFADSFTRMVAQTVGE